MIWKKIFTLDEAALKLSSEKLDEPKIKTKVWWLYDIANVLQSINLIWKTSLDINRCRPAYEWIGESGLDEFINEMKTNEFPPKEKPEDHF